MENIAPIQLHTNFKSNTNLISQILELTNKSYVTNTQLIEREIEHNSDIYIINNDQEELLAFFMVNFERVIGIDSYYLGLSACRDDCKYPFFQTVKTVDIGLLSTFSFHSIGVKFPKVSCGLL